MSNRWFRLLDIYVLTILGHLRDFVLFSQMLRLQSALEESQLSEKQLRHKFEIQSEMLNNKMEELRALNETSQSSMTSEMMEVQMKVVELVNVKVLSSGAPE